MPGCAARSPFAFRIDKTTDQTPSKYVIGMQDRIIQSRPIVIDLTLFDLLAANDPIKLAATFPIFNNKNLVVEFISIESTAEGDTLFNGVVRGQPLSTVTVIRSGDKFNMDIQTEQGVFQVIHNGSTHELIQLDLPGVPQATDDIDHVSSIPAPSTSVIYPIDILVLVSTDASASAGGIDVMTSLISLAIHETNTGFANSNVNAHAAVVQIVETSGEPDSYSDALYCLVERNDDCLEAVHGIRDDVYADLVLYVMDNNQSCGSSWVNTTFNQYAETTAFGTLNWRCMVGYYGFAKEIGHLMGAQTDRANSNYRVGAFDYSYGYQASDTSFRTIMALDCATSCPRINYWSNPAVYYNGKPTGVASGDYAADNHRTLNETAPIVSDYRIPPSPPDKAILVSPIQNQALVELNPTFTWNLLYDASEYNLELRKLSDGILVDSIILTATEACDAAYCSHAFGINYPPGDYTWRVAGINSIGQGEWSNMNTFILRHPALITISPTANTRVFNPQPTLSWQASSLAPNYQIRLVNAAGTILFDTTKTKSELCSGDVCNYKVPSALTDGDYRWYVRAVLSYPGLFGSASTFAKVTLSAPEASAPVANDQFYNNDILFKWKHVNMATSYNIEITNLATQVTTKYTRETNQVCPTNACSFTLPSGFTPSNYRWRINAQFRTFPGYWTTTSNFSILQLPATSLIAPSHQSVFVDSRPILQWAAIENPDLHNYQLHIREVPSGDLVYGTYITPSACTGGTCSFELPSSLPTGNYQWHVRGKTNTILGKWSVYREFTQEYTPGTPSLVSPSNGSILYISQPTFRWNPVQLAENYQILFIQNGTTTIGDWTVNNDVCSSTQCEYKIPLILTQYDTYQWKIRAIRNGINSEWSETFSYTYKQLAKPTQISPINYADITDNQPVFTWKPVAGATAYPLQVFRQDGIMLLNTLASASTYCTSTLCTYHYENSLPNDAYYWHVRGKVDRNFSLWSPYWQFEIIYDASVEFNFNGTANGWNDLSDRWTFFNQVYYRGAPGNASYFSAITYYEEPFGDAVFESHMRSVGINAKDGFSLLLRSQFSETGEFVQGYTIDVVGTENGIDISGWRISTTAGTDGSNENFSMVADLSNIDITLFHVYRLEVVDSIASLYIDDQLVYTMSIDPTYTQGSFGYDVISHHQSGHSVDINWARITPIR